MNDYEIQRLENLKQKQKLLADLNLGSFQGKKGAAVHKHDTSLPAKKRRKIAESNSGPPSRSSARIASSDLRPSYKEDGGDRYQGFEPAKAGRGNLSKRIKREPGGQGISSGSLSREPSAEQLLPAIDAEEFRSRWTAWSPTATPPTRDDLGTFHFSSHPSFLPNKSPEEVLREGCFGGSYFRTLRSRKLGIQIQDDWKELPATWIQGLDVSKYLTSPNYDADANKFKVACGQSIEQWEAAGWINHTYDVRGWFQWYLRFFQGRRCDDDDRQVSRWRKCVGETGRWRRMLLKKYIALGVREVFDDGLDDETPEVSPVMHQTCHHWAFEVRQNVLDDVWKIEG